MTVCLLPVDDKRASWSMAVTVMAPFWLECSWTVVLGFLMVNFGGSFSSVTRMMMLAESSSMLPLPGKGWGRENSYDK